MAEPQVELHAVSDDVERTLDFVRGALGAAGHSITDPVSLELLERYARGKISGDECRAALIDHTLHS
ncbi:antitoxin VbhA family protein [Gulosibacter hominis]|uniref:antitoxin VbhA family protein n=1 Tax=Gulosibacter hominis TaxID=2770504 RepID=UPI00191A952D|nr:antitoxin VbhA family protein [Gulosibacter hominis]